MKKTLIILMLLYIVSSCQDEMKEEIDNLPENGEVINVNGPYTVEDGMLNFSSLETLGSFLGEIEEQLKPADENQQWARGLSTTVLPEGFLPLADGYDRYAMSARAEGDDDGEQFSPDLEQAINENLIPNEALHYVLDTARRVKIAGKIHQITEVGAFSYDAAHTAEFENTYENFLNGYLDYSQQIDENTYQYGNIIFEDSYGFVSRKDLTEDNVIDFMSGNYETSEKGVDDPSTSGRTYDEHTKIYGLRTVRTNFSSGLGFFNVRTATFDSDHRVAVSLDHVNYGFVKYTNFKVKFQGKKRVRACIRIFRRRRCRTLFTYWVKRRAEKMVIGIDDLKAELKYPFSIEGSEYVDARKKWSKRLAEGTVEMAFKGIFETDIVKDWTSGLRTFGSRIQVAGNKIDPWKKGLDLLEKEVSKRTNRFVLDATGYDKDAPIMLVTPRLDKEYYYFNGVTEYRNVEKRKMKFPVGSFVGIGAKASGGGSLKPDLPKSNEFKLKSGGIFGAVYYNGRWRGVRVQR